MRQHALTGEGLCVLPEKPVAHPYLPLREVRTHRGLYAVLVLHCPCGFVGNPHGHRHHIKRLAEGGEDTSVQRLFV